MFYSRLKKDCVCTIVAHALIGAMCTTVGQAIVMAARRYRIKTENEGLDYLVCRFAFDVRDHAEAKAAELAATFGGRYWVMEEKEGE